MVKDCINELITATKHCFDKKKMNEGIEMEIPDYEKILSENYNLDNKKHRNIVVRLDHVFDRVFTMFYDFKQMNPSPLNDMDKIKADTEGVNMDDDILFLINEIDGILRAL